jgi:hypothetical protein
MRRFIMACVGFRPEKWNSEFDKIVEIGRVKRRSRLTKIWDLLEQFSLIPMMAMFHEAGGVASEIDIYHDEKSLKAEHRAAIETAIKKTSAELVNEQIIRRGLNAGELLQFSEIIPVKKSATLNEADGFQLGTTIPHHLCAQSDALWKLSESKRFRKVDITERIISVLSHFTTESPA